QKILDDNVSTLWEIRRLLLSSPQSFSSIIDRFNQGEFKVDVQHREFEKYRAQELRNNSLNRMLWVSSSLFIGGCLVTGLEQTSYWGISLLSWILFTLSLLVFIILLLKKYKLNS